MKSIFMGLFLLVVLMHIMNWQALPEKVAVHFGSGGYPNGWADKDSYSLMLLAMYLLFFLMFHFSSALIFKVPARWVNLPNKDYWLRPENKPLAQMKVEKAMYEMGMVVFLFFGYLGYLSTQANMNPPARLDESEFFLALTVFVILMILWIMRLCSGFRIPRNPVPHAGKR
jgi:uncharacterized membrane protein